MKLLIVCASGFLGRNIVEASAKWGWEVAGTYWKSDTFPRFAARFGCEPICHNLLDEPRSWDADVSIYLAGNSDHRMSVESPINDLRLNAEGLVRFLHGFSGGLVFMSSAAVYDGHSGLVSPETRINPRLPYAISKFASEQYAKHHVDRGQLAWATVLRLYYTYGPYDRPSRLIPRVVWAVRHRSQAFIVSAAAESLIDPLFINDVTGAALAAAKGKARGHTVDLCAGCPRTVPDLVRESLAILESEMDVRVHPRVEETPVRFHSNAELGRSKLGLDPCRSFADGLRQYLGWQELQAGWNGSG